MGALSKIVSTVISAFVFEFERLRARRTRAGSRARLVKKRTGQTGKRTAGRKRTRWVMCEQCQRNRMACTGNCGRCFECCTRHGKAMTW